MLRDFNGGYGKLSGYAKKFLEVYSNKKAPD